MKPPHSPIMIAHAVSSPISFFRATLSLLEELPSSRFAVSSIAPGLKRVCPVHLGPPQTHTGPLLSRLLLYLGDREEARMRTRPRGTLATVAQVGWM